MAAASVELDHCSYGAQPTDRHGVSDEAGGRGAAGRERRQTGKAGWGRGGHGRGGVSPGPSTDANGNKKTLTNRIVAATMMLQQ